METPTSGDKGRPVRKHTPRLSERKKSLFAPNINEVANYEDDMEGIVPLTGTTVNDEDNNVACTPLTNKRVLRARLESKANSPQKTPNNEAESKYENSRKKQRVQPARRSLRLTSKTTSPNSKAVSPTNSEKENAPIEMTKNNVGAAGTEDRLEELFVSLMRLENQRSPKTPQNQNDTIKSHYKNANDLVMDSDDCSSEHSYRNTSKRHADKSNSTSPQQSKIPRMEDERKMHSISTKSFYAGKVQNPRCIIGNNETAITKLQQRYSLPANLSESKKLTSPTTRASERRNVRLNVHKNVMHKIKRPRHSMSSRSTNIDRIISNMTSDKLRNLINAERKEKQQIEKIHNIFREAKNPIAMAKPLSTLTKDDDNDHVDDVVVDDSNNNNKEHNNNLINIDRIEKDLNKMHQEVDFSDLETESETDSDDDDDDDDDNDDDDVNVNAKTNADEEQQTAVPETTLTNKKFFKSGATKKNLKQVTITEHIKASVKNGKISLIKKKRRRRSVKLKPISTHKFSDEQAIVNEILQQLDDNALDDVTTTFPADDKITDTSFASSTVTGSHVSYEEPLNDIELNDVDGNDYMKFLKKLPYNTNDTEIIARQKLLLDFLIKNNICNDKTFEIFIADPDNHKEEAARIVDQVVMVVNKKSEFFDRIPYNTEDPDIIAQQQSFLYFLNEHNLCNEENFDIFIANYETRKEEAEAIVEVVQRQLRYTPSEIGTTEDTSDMPIPNVNTFNQEFLNTNNSVPIFIDDINNLATLDVKTTADTKDIISSNTITATATTITTTTTTTPTTPIKEFDINTQITDNTTTVTTTKSPLKSANTESKKLYPIFDTSQWRPLLPAQNTRKIPRIWNAGYGLNQYQIDAGQKSFGARQCKVCGLVYAVHEPEEEKLHREFHSSVFILSFKGWIDEDLVTKIPEWGTDGRILRVTESSTAKRRERLMEVLSVVDKELGFSTYIMPKIFVAFLAVRKNQFIGLCLVQPLKTANRYLCINGVDCCTTEEFEAKVGVSRIWVSPLNRRRKVASKLLAAVQNFTIFSEVIPLEKIAFSAPTEQGKIFATKITKTENFLVYQ